MATLTTYNTGRKSIMVGRVLGLYWPNILCGLGSVNRNAINPLQWNKKVSRGNNFKCFHLTANLIVCRMCETKITNSNKHEKKLNSIISKEFKSWQKNCKHVKQKIVLKFNKMFTIGIWLNCRHTDNRPYHQYSVLKWSKVYDIWPPVNITMMCVCHGFWTKNLEAKWTYSGL